MYKSTIGKMNIFEAIREDHKKQRTLIDLLLKTQGDSGGRSELFDNLKEEIRVHARAEERNFYNPLFKSDYSQDKARHGVAEHQELEELLEKLEDTDMSSPSWLTTAKTLADRLIHHLDEEEHEFFQIAGKVFSDAEKKNLAEMYKNHMQEREAV
jgi:hemerythrin-like domain-containing protein